jgi:DNA/RNA-binding domain of Phe-tRNA-synthetase-like protein
MIHRSTNSGWVMWLAIAVFAVAIAGAAIIKAIDEHHKLVVAQADWQIRSAEHAVHAYEAVYIGFAKDFDRAIERIEALEKRLGESQ